MRSARYLGQRCGDVAECGFALVRPAELEESRDRSGGDVFQQRSGAGNEFCPRHFLSCLLRRITGAITCVARLEIEPRLSENARPQAHGADLGCPPPIDRPLGR